jgi:anti-anti-sigma factor
MDKDDRRVTEDDSQCWAVRDPALPAVGTLVVRTERRGAVLIFWLSGALDRATSRVLDDNLDAQAHHARRVVVDLTELAFIDSYGLTTLERILRRTPGSRRKRRSPSPGVARAAPRTRSRAPAFRRFGVSAFRRFGVSAFRRFGVSEIRVADGGKPPR